MAQVEANPPKNQLSVDEVADRASAASQLITAGTRNTDGPTIKAGILLYKSIGYPLQMIVAIARYLVQEAKK